MVLTSNQERLLKAYKMMVSILKKASKNHIVTINVLIMENSEKVYFNTTKNISYDAFGNLALHTLDKVTPIKQKYIRGN